MGGTFVFSPQTCYLSTYLVRQLLTAGSTNESMPCSLLETSYLQSYEQYLVLQSLDDHVAASDWPAAMTCHATRRPRVKSTPVKQQSTTGQRPVNDGGQRWPATVNVGGQRWRSMATHHFMSSYTHPSIPSDYDVEDAFSSTNAPNYIPTPPSYSSVTSGNISPDSSDDLTKDL
ncbi:hypothetical protein Tco_0859505 [Tanacetum coccineum]|uniref:Uncharacterized protein n=1 Tax=Tanacetum coccineum TaxID=301880 RepID=A0ABQ5BF65_9ASTR